MVNIIAVLMILALLTKSSVFIQIVINVRNDLWMEGVTIHWHGLPQKGTPFMDGVARVTQCPINPGETFTYR